MKTFKIYKNLVLIGTSSLFIISSFFDVILFYTFYTLLGSIGVLGLLTVLLRVGSIVAYITMPPIFDVLGIKRSYIVLLLLNSVLYLVFIVSVWFWRLGLHAILILLALSLNSALIVLIFESMLPEMFSEQDLIRANAILRVFRFALTPLVLMIGGVIADLLGYLEVLVIICILLSLNSIMVALATINVEVAQTRSTGGFHELSVDTFLEGFKFLLKNKAILRLMIYTSIASISMVLITGLYPVAMARVVLGEKVFYYTLIEAIISITYGAGALATIILYRFLRVRYATFLAISLITLSILITMLSLTITLRSSISMLIAIALISLVSGTYDNVLTYLYQTNIPLEVRARVFGVRYLLMLLASIVGTPIGGWMADLLGLSTSIAILSILPLATGILSLMSKDLRSLDIKTSQT